MTIEHASRPAGRFQPEKLFRPSSVAVLGAGTDDGRQVMGNLLAGGFKGAILPVGAGLGSVGGVLAYPDIAALPIAPDLAVICLAAKEIPAAMAALGRRGTLASVVIGMAGGLRSLAVQTGVRSLGPGSFGIAVPSLGLNASRSHLPPRPGRVALVSQSAALCRAVLDWAEPNGVGFSHIVGIGGNDDIGFALVLDWLSRDPGTGAILLDIRRIKNGRLFLSAARAAARLRPVVAIRAGGRLIDPSGEADAGFAAALRRCGVLGVSTLEDLLAAAETLTRARPARSESLAIVTNAVGPAQMAADAVLRDGLRLAQLSPETRAVLALAGPGEGVSEAEGGIVYAGLANPVRLAEIAALLAGAREVGGVLAVHAPTGAEDDAAMEALKAASVSLKVPLLVCAMGETTAAAHRRRLAEAGVPAFATPEHAVRGFLHLVQDRRNRAAARELPPRAVLALAPDRAAVATLFRAARDAGRLTLAQDEALAVLAAYGIAPVPGRVAAGPEEAAQAATLLGFPAVLKRRRVTRPDPRARGSVALDLRTPEQVRLAAEMLAAGNGGCGSGLLVQRQVGRTREVRIRVGEDAVFGPTIGFGPGGAGAEMLHELVLDLPPLNLPLAHGLIARSRLGAILAADRPGEPVAGEDALADTLVRVSQMVVDFPEMAELDVNPLFVEGSAVLAADAWIRLRGADQPPAALAIPPYPAELAETFTSGEERFSIRPIRPEDAEAHGAMFTRLSPEDIRYRFFSAMRELSREQIARMTQIDYDREMAFIAVREARGGEPNGETVGVARLVRESPGEQGEFAVVVQPDMKGRGLASQLMRRLIDWARSQGMSAITGQVLSDNQPMLAFVRRLGFTLHRIPGETDVVEARLML